MLFRSVLILGLCGSVLSTIAQQINDSVETDQKIITIEEAVETTLNNNPNLTAFKYEIKSLEKIKIQAGLIPNPEAGFEMENFFGGKELNGFQGTEYTIAASQLFELGGKRGSRVNLADNEINSALGNYELIKIDLIARVKTAFINLSEVHSRILLQRKFIQINEEILMTISERVKAGRTSPAEESKVKVALINSQIELQRLERNYSSAQSVLNSLLGTFEKNIVPSTSIFDKILIPPDKENLFAELDSIPTLKYLNNETNLRKAELELEEAQSVPDITVILGARYLNEIETNAFIAGLTMPIPIFDRNQGNIQSAEVRIQQMDEIIRARKLAVISSLNTSFNNLFSAYNNSVQLRESILPESEKAYEITRQGYLQGRFAFIDLLDAQRTLFDTEAQYLLELADYYKSLIELENLTGKTFIK